MSLKCDACSDEDAAGETNMGNTFTDGVKFAGIDTEDEQGAENDVGDDEEKVSHTETGKEMMENTFHRFLTKDSQTQCISN